MSSAAGEDAAADAGAESPKPPRVDFFGETFQGEYKRKLRQLAFNLRKNVKLREERGKVKDATQLAVERRRDLA